MPEDRFNKFKCGICGNLIMSETWGGGECQLCHSVSAITIPLETELKEHYLKFNRIYTGGSVGGRNLKRYAYRYLQLVKRFISCGSLIDIGTSKNPFPNIALNYGFNVTVIDYSKPEHLDPRINFVEGTLNEKIISQKYANNFDVVTAWAVLEHSSNVAIFCENLAILCKPNGYIFLSTPEAGTFLTRYALGRSGWFHPPDHLHLISPLGAKKIMERYNCILLKWGRFELTPARYIARYGLGLMETSVGYLVKLFRPRRWHWFRANKIQKFKGIVYFVFKKLEKISNYSQKPQF